MSRRSRFQDRWEPVFGPNGVTPATWWSDILHLHDELDWEGFDRSIEDLVYNHAKALASSVVLAVSTLFGKRGSVPDAHAVILAALKHPCPKCSRPHTTSTTWQCAVCDAEDKAKEEENRRAEAERQMQHEIWLASLTPEQRRQYEEECKQMARIAHYGLMKRDVQ